MAARETSEARETGADRRQGTGRPRILIVTHETLGERLAGPGIRCWELAKVLSSHCSVVLAAPGVSARQHPGVTIAPYRRGDDAAIAALATAADAILTLPYLAHELPSLARSGKPLILDLYDPFILETLEAGGSYPPSEQQRIHQSNVAVLNEQIQRGDFFLCASERQRDFWLGMLAARLRINPFTYAQDKSLRQLVAVVPFGLPGQPPVATSPVLKGVYPGIGADDKVVLWAGGLWPWLDPLTLIRAAAQVVRKCPDVKLYFMSRGHFDSGVAPDSAWANEAVHLSRELGLLDRHVFFGDWIPYDHRADYLLESDIGVSLHSDTLESHFAWRTRVLDYLWAGLPMLLSSGDVLSDEVRQQGLGVVVAPGDVAGVAAGILDLLDKPGLRQEQSATFSALGQQYRWERVAAPLLAFCVQPHRAADLAAGVAPSVIRGSALAPSGVRGRLASAGAYLRQGGFPGLWRATAVFLRLHIARWRQRWGQR
jgi:glycosyltransferase involved in cell wall biosynthesis